MELNNTIILIIVAFIVLIALIVPNIPFTESQFYSQATDLNYSKVKAGDYNNMVLVFDGNKISVADANDLNVALPDLSVYVPYQGATQDVNLGEHNLRASGLFGNYFGIQSLAVASEAIGGVVTYEGNYVIHTFKSSGTFVSPQNINGAEVLVVGGGGAGGAGYGGGGGGGAGGVLYQLSRTINAGSYPIVIGAGGAGGYQQSGLNGEDTTFDGLTAYGGGGGGFYTGSHTEGSNGGSGGGGNLNWYGGTATQDNQDGATGYGYNGGSSTELYGGGAGGGATSIGGNGINENTGGTGGSGFTFHGNVYAGGGGGGRAGVGTDGGGNGGNYGAGQDATTPGSGGGGGGDSYNAGGSGGSGIVIIRYLKLNSIVSTDKNITFDGNNFVFDGGGKFNGNLNLDGNFFGNQIYGEDYNKLDGGFETIDLVTPDVYVRARKLGAGSLNGFTVSDGNLIASYTGKYMVTVSISSTSSGNGEFGAKVYVNDSGQNNCYAHWHGNINQANNVAINCIVSLTVGQNINLRFDDHMNPVNDLDLESVNISVMRVGN